MTSPDGDDVLAADDTSASYATKSITLTKIKEWLQSLTSWITAAMITDGVVSSAKLDLTIGCRAYLNSAANMGSGPAKVVLDAEAFDVGSNFNTTTGTFTAPVTGYYFVQAQIAAADVAASSNILVYIYVNGSAVAFARAFSDVSTRDPTVSTSGLFAVTAGQTIEMWQDATTVEPMSNSSTATFMSIYFAGV